MVYDDAIYILRKGHSILKGTYGPGYTGQRGVLHNLSLVPKKWRKFFWKAAYWLVQMGADDVGFDWPSEEYPHGHIRVELWDPWKDERMYFVFPFFDPDMVARRTFEELVMHALHGFWEGQWERRINELEPEPMPEPMPEEYVLGGHCG